MRSPTRFARASFESNRLPVRAEFSAFPTEPVWVPAAQPSGNGDEVIPEVDQALKTLIEREAVDPAEVEVVFDAPTKEWASRRNGPTVDVYLYDIREDLRRRERVFLNEYDGNRVRARHLPPRYFKLSYLVAAWTQRPEDEHRLLASLLLCFLRYDALPSDVLSGSLAELGLSVPVSIALPPPEDRSFADVWTALGGELKPSLDIVVTAPVDSRRSFPAGPPVQWPTTLIAEGLNGSVPAETLPRGATPNAARNVSTEAGASVRIRKRRPKSGGSSR